MRWLGAPVLALALLSGCSGSTSDSCAQLAERGSSGETAVQRVENLTFTSDQSAGTISFDASEVRSATGQLEIVAKEAPDALAKILRDLIDALHGLRLIDVAEEGSDAPIKDAKQAWDQLAETCPELHLEPLFE